MLWGMPLLTMLPTRSLSALPESCSSSPAGCCIRLLHWAMSCSSASGWRCMPALLLSMLFSLLSSTRNPKASSSTSASSISSSGSSAAFSQMGEPQPTTGEEPSGVVATVRCACSGVTAAGLAVCGGVMATCVSVTVWLVGDISPGVGDTSPVLSSGAGEHVQGLAGLLGKSRLSLMSRRSASGLLDASVGVFSVPTGVGLG
mmetsp:Transcript_11579/g.46808  ORF Transcript_11579/g.46808 Transcript_11579/m.46808 type:complete len:202 (+) Transcript_11579:1934-2539(+)